MILIDQPEDDLDNQTIYEDVIKDIDKLKANMQFIFATHNANSPVLGDAERVIAFSFEDNKINTHIGNIDVPDTQDHIVNIMEGGKLIIGVSDQGDLIGLSPQDISRLNQMISNVAAQHIRHPIHPETENVKVVDNRVIVVTIPEGLSKPYMDNHGLIWVKSGADKRKVTAVEELRRLFQESDLIHADEIPVAGTSIAELNMEYFHQFYQRFYDEDLDQADIPLSLILENMNLLKNGKLNLAGLMLFAKHPQRWKPFQVKAVSFYGNDETATSYRDSEDIEGHLEQLFHHSESFIKRNLHQRQMSSEFNSEGQLEIPSESIRELLVNMFIHRDYFFQSPYKIFIFENRVELISAGHLPNNLTLENIKAGVSVVRNPFIHSFASKILPYKGVGTGIRRALKMYPHIDFENDISNNLFRCILHRR